MNINGQSGQAVVNLWRWAYNHYLVSLYQVLKSLQTKRQKTRSRLACVFWPIDLYTMDTKAGQLVVGGVAGLFIPTSLAREGKLKFILREC